MGLKCSPDFAQEVMENIFHDLEDTNVYIDDVDAFSKTWEHHIILMDTVLNRLQNNSFTINLLRYEWAVEETDWLGHWLTPTGLTGFRVRAHICAQVKTCLLASLMYHFLRRIPIQRSYDTISNHQSRFK